MSRILFALTAIAVASIPVLGPGSHDLQTKQLPLGEQVNRYEGAPAPDSAVRELYHETITMADAGSGVLLMVRNQQRPKFSFIDSVRFERAGLAPLTEHMHMNNQSRMLRYIGDSVEVTIQNGDSASHLIGRKVPQHVFGFNQVETIVQSLPYRAGYEGILPLYSEGTDVLEMDTVQVTGKTDAGEWTVRFADPAIVSTYTVNGATRKVTGYQVAVRKGGMVYTRMR